MTTSSLATVAPTDPMSVAAQAMLAKDVNLLPVVEGRRVVGIVTRHDVLRCGSGRGGPATP